jgi:hypothetical protein
LPLAANIQFQDYQFKSQTVLGLWRWTTRMDVSQPSPAYEIRDVSSPWGLLRDSVPIPGDIVMAMAESIAELKQAFAPSILLGPPSALNFVLDEGRGFGEAQQVQITNGGVYGSLLSTSLTTSATYIRVAPDKLGNIAFSESGVFNVLVDSTNLLAVNSPYAATVVLQDPNATNTPQTLPVTVTVRPKANIDASPANIAFIAVSPGGGGPFPPIPSQQIVIQNTGPVGSVLNYQVQKLTGQSEWLVSFAPVTGTLVSSATQVLTVVAQPPAGMLPGVYTETLRISGYSLNSYQDVTVQLVVS